MRRKTRDSAAMEICCRSVSFFLAARTGNRFILIIYSELRTCRGISLYAPALFISGLPDSQPNSYTKQWRVFLQDNRIKSFLIKPYLKEGVNQFSRDAGSLSNSSGYPFYFRRTTAKVYPVNFTLVRR